MLEAVEASQWYFFENWLLKLKFPHLLKPLGTIIQQNYWFFYPSEPFSYDHFNMIHPVCIAEKKLEFYWIRKVIYTTILQTLLVDYLLDMQENLHWLDWFDFDIIFNKVRICKTNWFPFMWLGFLLHLFPKIGWNLFWRSIFHNFMHLCFHKTLLKPFLGILWNQRWINLSNSSQELISTHYDIGNQCFSGFVLLVPKPSLKIETAKRHLLELSCYSETTA